ncbi:DUF4038 domain-containing protein [Candidatus Poribacteria bacterium]|nr:DUF4038 domain-containing protein [Candidatus Poribacteria bacterium]
MLRISKTKDYLLKNGEPFFYLADTVWAAFANLSVERWQGYLKFRRTQGFNAIQISILPITHDTSTSKKNAHPFLLNGDGNWDFYRLDEAYFDKAERMVSMAVESGFVPVLGVVWKNYVPGTSASQRSPIPSAMPLDAMKAYAKYAAERFKKYAPIFFISGDTAWDSDEEPLHYMAALEIVRRICPDSLITMHLGTRSVLPDDFAEKVDFYMYQSGHSPEQKTPYELAKRHQEYAVKRPVVNGEPCYEGHGRGQTLTRFRAYDVRKATWQSLLSGAKMGMTYGGHGIWSCHSDGMGFVNPTWKFVPYDWEEALRLPGAWDVAYAKWLFEHFELFDLNPVDVLVREDEEVAVSSTPDRTRIALYAPHAYDVALKLDLSGYRCEAFDLENRRPFVPTVETGSSSTVYLSMFNSDALFLAMK